MKIGITLDMSTAFWANGMQQNIVFLYSLLKQVPENDCYYITQKKPSSKLDKRHKGMLLDDIMSDESEKFDVLIIAGFDLLPDMYDELYKRNNNIKIITYVIGIIWLLLIFIVLKLVSYYFNEKYSYIIISLISAILFIGLVYAFFITNGKI